MLKRNSINVHCKFSARQKWELAGRVVILDNFWTVSLIANGWSS